MNFFISLWAKFKSYLGKTLPHTKTAIEYGIDIAEKLNTVLQSPVIDLLTHIIPGKTDDVIVDILRRKLPCILVDLNLVDKAIDKKDTNAVITSAMTMIQSKKGTVKSALLHSIASIAAEAASQEDLSWSEIVSIIEEVYQDNKSKAE